MCVKTKSNPCTFLSSRSNASRVARVDGTSDVQSTSASSNCIDENVQVRNSDLIKQLETMKVKKRLWEQFLHESPNSNAEQGTYDKRIRHPYFIARLPYENTE